MKLNRLLTQVSHKIVRGDCGVEISTLVYDSGKAVTGSVFVCMKGAELDGHEYAGEAVERGAVAVVAERELNLPAGITLILVEDSRCALARMSSAFFDDPAEKLITIGITGTKGKTTTAYMIKEILEHAGIPTGLMGTIEVCVKNQRIPAHNTTPESYELQSYLAWMVREGMRAVVMEVSSQALKLHRVEGILFDYGVFTNLEPDHIGAQEHRDFSEYLQCKRQLFQNCRVGILNRDCPYYREMLKEHTCLVENYGTDPECDCYSRDVRLITEESRLGVSYHVMGPMEGEIQLGVPGRFNVVNSLAAILVCSHFGVSEAEVQEALRQVQVKGRLESIPTIPGVTVFVDYAHNAMALRNLLTTLREYHPRRLICMFGCGGNRAKARRFEMGEVSSALADLTVVTSDNPRYEDPQEIIEDIMEGVRRADGDCVTIADRQEAVTYCLKQAKSGDVIVLAGKGHENYQEIEGVRYPMTEQELVLNSLKSIWTNGNIVL